MTTVLGCIADDFTGATDLAALLARSGLAVSLRTGIPTQSTDNSASLEVIALKCRTIPVADALDQVRQALQWLRKAGAQRIFWKYCSTFDSTAEGNIGPVAEMMMAELGTRQTIYCPAFPENGRTVYMGHLFVGEQLLSESPMKDHPLTPMQDSNLVRLLSPQVHGKVGLAHRLVVARGPDALKTRLEQLDSEDVAHVITDAVSDDDLRTIATATAHMSLVTGGSAIAGQLPRLYIEQGLVAAPTDRTRTEMPAGGQIVLSGSCSAMTRKQVSYYIGRSAALRLDPIALAREGAGAAEAWLRQRSAEEPKLVFATAEPEEVQAAQQSLGFEKASQVVEQALSDLARQAFRSGVRRFVVAGGETSGAITQALGITRLEIGPEIAPGVPWTFAKVEGKRVALALKSGNFGAETFFEDAIRLTDGA